MEMWRVAAQLFITPAWAASSRVAVRRQLTRRSVISVAARQLEAEIEQSGTCVHCFRLAVRATPRGWSSQSTVVKLTSSSCPPLSPGYRLPATGYRLQNYQMALAPSADKNRKQADETWKAITGRPCRVAHVLL